MAVTSPPLSMAVPVVLCDPSSPASGDPVIVCGHVPGVAVSGVDLAGEVEVAWSGSFSLTVRAVNESGPVAVAKGDAVYLGDGVRPMLSARRSGRYFGWAMEPVAAGAAKTIKVWVH